jgi:uncharacterized protein YecE (DUF72 family)/uncharacterized protein YjlB
VQALQRRPEPEHAIAVFLSPYQRGDAMMLLEDLKKTTEKITGWQRPAETQLGELVSPGKVGKFRFRDDGATPNHPRWPLLILWSAVRLPRSLDPAAVFEDIFRRNGWTESWRDGVYDYPHYHSRIHEVMGIARGNAKVRFGGDHGRTIKLSAGDVAILPAGTGHQCIAASKSLLVVGAYPSTGTLTNAFRTRPTCARYCQGAQGAASPQGSGVRRRGSAIQILENRRLTSGTVHLPAELKSAARVWVGTSGWMYDSWRGPLYPDDLAKREWLSYYASQFPTVEINSAFYRTPSLEAVRSWRNDTPDDFRFAWKASKFITHWKRLSDKCENSIALMQTRLKALSPKVSVVLFQLPPQFMKDTGRLSSFLRLLPRRRYAFEFRHPSWYDDAVFQILNGRNVALCISDHADAPAPWLATARHIYVRGHGPGGDYRGSYPARTLRRWASAIDDWRSRGHDVFVYFDNDQKAAAPADTRRLTHLLAG